MLESRWEAGNPKDLGGAAQALLDDRSAPRALAPVQEVSEMIGAAMATFIIKTVGAIAAAAVRILADEFKA